MRRKNTMVIAVGVLILLLGVLPSACAPAATQTPPETKTIPPSPTGPSAAPSPTVESVCGEYGGTLKVAQVGDPANLDPHVGTGASGYDIKQNVYNALFKVWRGQDILPDLADSWELPSDTEVVIHVREGVLFHNGDELTAEDVKFSLDRILYDESVAAEARGVLATTIDQVEAADRYTVKITLKAPNAAVVATLANPNTSIVSKRFMEEGGGLEDNMMGTGPFKFVEYVPAVHTTLVKNEDYFEEGLPCVDEVIFTPIADSTSRVAALQTEGVDLITYVPWEQIDTLEQDPNIEVYSDKGAVYMWLYFNVAAPPYDNKNVREAIAWAIDRQAMLEAAFFGRGSVMDGGIFPSVSMWHNPELDGSFGYDPQKSRQLLAEAGYPDGFETTIVSTDQYLMHKAVAEVLQANLADVGIDATLDLSDWATRVTRYTAQANEIQVQGMALDPDPDWLSAYFRTGGFYAVHQGLSDPELDQLLDEARATYDVDKRKELYNAAEKLIVNDNVYCINVCYREQADAALADVKNFEHIPGTWFSMRLLREVWLEQ